MSEGPTLNLCALCHSCAKIACCSSELIFTFLYASSGIQNANQQFISCVLLSSINFAQYPTPQTKICRNYVWRFKQLNLGNQSELDTCSYERLFSQRPIPSPPKIPTFLAGSPCIYSGADKSLARSGRRQATVTEDFDVHISYL
jgi:hypothetical protein